MDEWVDKWENEWVDICSRDLVMCPILLGFHSPNLIWANFTCGMDRWHLSPQGRVLKIFRFNSHPTWSVTMLRRFSHGTKNKIRNQITDISLQERGKQTICNDWSQWLNYRFTIKTDAPSLAGVFHILMASPHRLKMWQGVGHKNFQLKVNLLFWKTPVFQAGTTPEDANCMLPNLVWVCPL